MLEAPLTIQQGELVQPEERGVRPTTEEFRREPKRFRVQLALLGQWLPNAQTVPVTIHNLTHSIVRRLRAHTEQEALVIAELRDVLTIAEVLRIHPAAREIFTAFGIRIEETGMHELGGFRRVR